MKAVKYIVCGILLLGCLFGWYRQFSVLKDIKTEVENYITAAEKSLSQGLYKQAIENYKSALEIKDDVEIWKDIQVAYLKYIDEDSNLKIVREFSDDMLLAISKHPKESIFYISVLNQLIESGDIRSAKRITDLARKNNVKNDEISEISKQLTYMTKIDYRRWSSVLTSLNGYYVVSSNSLSIILDSDGEEISDRYEFISAVNSSGFAVVKNDRGYRLIDRSGIERAVLPDNLSYAGTYDEISRIVPICADDKWYLFSIDKGILPGSFDYASTFTNDIAVVLKNSKWNFIDTSGSIIEELPFEDIKLSLSGEYIQSGLILAKLYGKWHLFNSDLAQIGELSADKIDIFNGGLIAFEQNGKWGFSDKTGTIVKTPEYVGAKSFSNGFAGICDNNDVWGFINSDFELVIPCQFNEVGYFSSNRICYVIADSAAYQRLYFVLD